MTTSKALDLHKLRTSRRTSYVVYTYMATMTMIEHMFMSINERINTWSHTWKCRSMNMLKRMSIILHIPSQCTNNKRVHPSLPYQHHKQHFCSISQSVSFDLRHWRVATATHTSNKAMRMCQDEDEPELNRLLSCLITQTLRQLLFSRRSFLTLASS